MHRTVYLSPFDNPGNLYIERQKALWREIGFEVQPFTFGALRKRGAWRGVFDRKNAIAVHWLESRPFLAMKSGQNIQLKGLFAFFAYCLVLLVARARTIQFVHNHHVHDAPPKMRSLSARLTSLLAHIVDVRVVHDPGSAPLYNAVYLPHPLYREPGTPSSNRAADTWPLFGALGAIKPYKRIDALLQCWPSRSKLLLAGSANSETISMLHAIIVARDLASNVTTNFRFLSQDEFNAYLDRIDVLILPHAPESNLVSGAFFEAIGRVPAILARRSTFSLWAQQQMPGIYLFDDDASFAAAIDEIHTNWSSSIRESVPTRANELFGWETCRATYAQAFAA